MQEQGAARFSGAQGRIPNFPGAEAAARRLAALPEWDRAETLKCNPDSPQLPEGPWRCSKESASTWPCPGCESSGLSCCSIRAFSTEHPRKAASIKGSASAGRPVGLDQMPHIDLIVCGTVAVNRDGARIGKGGGYSDLEFALTRRRASSTTPR